MQAGQIANMVAVEPMLCPVCGYDRLEEPPEDYNICPCCGTEFGYEDFAVTEDGRKRQWSRLRQRWIRRGMRWFSPVLASYPGWDPAQQLLRLDIGVSIDAQDLDDSDSTSELVLA